MNHSYVIGGGLSGLIFAALHPSCDVILGRSGTDLVSKGVSPIIIHHYPKIADWVKWMYRTGLRAFRQPVSDPGIVECAVEHYYDGAFHAELPALLAAEYFYKSRQQPLLRSVPGRNFRDVPDGSFAYYDMDVFVFMAGLRAFIGEDRLIHDSVAAVTGSTILLASGRVLEYERLASTLLAPAWFSLFQTEDPLQKPGKFIAAGKQYAALDNVLPRNTSFLPSWLFQQEKQGYVYYPQISTNPFLLRVCNIRGALTAELTLEPKLLTSYAEVPCAYFLTPPSSVPLSPKNVEYVGRFAEWDENVLADMIIRRYLSC